MQELPPGFTLDPPTAGGSANAQAFDGGSAAPPAGPPAGFTVDPGPQATTDGAPAAAVKPPSEGVWKTKPHDGNGIPQELLLPVMENQSVAKLGPSGVLEAGIIGEPKPLSVKLNTNTGYYEVRDSDGKWINSFPTAQDAAEGLFIEKYAGPDGSPQMVATVNDPKFQESFKSYFGRYPFGGNGEGGPSLIVDVGGQIGEPDPSRTYDDARAGAGGSADTFARSAANFFTAGLADDAEAALDTLTGGGTFKENIQRQHAINDSDWREHRIAYVGGAIMGALGLPSGISKSAAQAGVEAGSKVLRMGGSQEAAREAAKAAAYRAATVRGAGEGAAYGGVSGATSADNPTDALTRGVGGAATGAIFGGGATAVGGRFIRPSLSAPERNAATDAQAFAAAADRQGIDYLAADRPKAGVSQFATAVTNSTMGAIPISESAAKAVDTVKSARDRVASMIGDFRTTEGGAADTTFAGQRVQKGVQSFLTDSERKATTLYDAIPIPPTSNARLTSTRAALDELTTGFESNEALSRLWAENPRLQATRDALTLRVNDKPYAQSFTEPRELGNLSWGDLKRFRSIVGEIIGKPGLDADGNQIAAMRKLYGALSEDMRATAAENGPGALRSFERANGFYNAVQNRKESVFSAVLGKNFDASPEDAYRTLKGWASAQGGDFANTARLIRSLPEGDADVLRATVLGTMGRVSKGRQDVTGNVFSPADFVTHWNDLSDRAKNVLFQGDHRKAIDDIVTVASGMKASGKYANTSKTGIAVGATGTIGTFLANPVLGTMTVLGQFGAGKLLGSPKFAKWLSSFGRKPNPQAVRDHISRLATLARAEPQLAGDILGLQRRLSDAFSGDVPLRAAAQQDQGNSSVPDWDSPQYESDNYGAAPAAANDTAPYSAPAGDPNGDPSMGTPYADDGTDGNYADWTGQ